MIIQIASSCSIQRWKVRAKQNSLCRNPDVSPCMKGAYSLDINFLQKDAIITSEFAHIDSQMLIKDVDIDADPNQTVRASQLI